jgi:hypothetical protein
MAFRRRGKGPVQPTTVEGMDIGVREPLRPKLLVKRPRKKKGRLITTSRVSPESAASVARGPFCFVTRSSFLYVRCHLPPFFRTTLSISNWRRAARTSAWNRGLPERVAPRPLQARICVPMTCSRTCPARNMSPPGISQIHRFAASMMIDLEVLPLSFTSVLLKHPVRERAFSWRALRSSLGVSDSRVPQQIWRTRPS